jgi:hypothetical protein
VLVKVISDKKVVAIVKPDTTKQVPDNIGVASNAATGDNDNATNKIKSIGKKGKGKSKSTTNTG